MALTRCLADISSSKERDKIRLLPNPGELGFSCHFAFDVLVNLEA